jgi:SAM-dependent methyltransferase
MREPDPTTPSIPTGTTISGPAPSSAPFAGPDVRPGSVWLTGQTQSREQRRGRYLPESMTHPAKMLPAIARYAITTYTAPGEVVLDPMCGIGTTIVEAAHLGRHGIGVEYETRWAELARANLRHAQAQGATGSGEVWCADARVLPRPLPASLEERAALVLTSPPYGASTHGQARAPGPRRGKVGKVHQRYGSDPDNLAHRPTADLMDGFSRILAGAVTLLRPGGHVVITTRPYRRHGELVDIPGLAIAAAERAGLQLTDRCVALIAGVRGGRLVPRPSFFQTHNLRAARAAGDPQWLIGHEDALVLVKSLTPASPDISGGAE